MSTGISATCENTGTIVASSGRFRLHRRRLFVGSDYPSSGGSQPVSYEAETAGNTLSGSAAVAVCAGGSKVRFIGNNTSNHVTVDNVTAATAGGRQLTIRFFNNGAYAPDLDRITIS